MLYVRRDSDDVLELLTMLVEDESSDIVKQSRRRSRDAIHSLCIWFYKEKGERFDIEKCDEDDFEKLFR